MEIFIAPSVKSSDLNPTHPGPLPRASFHTSASRQIERSESKAVRGRTRSTTDEVGDTLQKSASSEQDELTNGRQRVARAESSCEFLRARGQEISLLRSASRSSLNGLATISRSRLAELQHAPPAWKFCAAQSQENLREPTNAFLIAGSGRPRRGHEKHCPAAWIKAAKKQARAAERKWKCSKAPVMELRGYCRPPGCVCNSSRLSSCLAAPIGPRPAPGFCQQVIFEPASLSQKITNAPHAPGRWTEAWPLGHRSYGGAPLRPRPARGQEALPQKAHKFSACEI